MRSLESKVFFYFNSDKLYELSGSCNENMFIIRNVFCDCFFFVVNIVFQNVSKNRVSFLIAIWEPRDKIGEGIAESSPVKFTDYFVFLSCLHSNIASKNTIF